MKKLQTGVSTDMDFIKAMKEKGQNVNAQFPAETLRKQFDEISEKEITMNMTNEVFLEDVANKDEPEPKEQVTLTIRTFPEDDDRLIVIDGEEFTSYVATVTKDIGTESTIHIESVGYLDYDGTILFDETKEVRIDMTQISTVGIEIVSEPTKKTYCNYERIDYTGLEVDLLYNDGNTERLSLEDLTLPEYAVEDEIVVNYNSEFEASFNITIEDFRLAVSTSLEKSIEEYKTNDEIVISGQADEDSVARLFSLEADHTFDGYIDFTYDNVTTTIDCTFRNIPGDPISYMIYIGGYEAMQLTESCDVYKLALIEFNFINANSDTPINYQEQQQIVFNGRELFDKITAMHSELDPTSAGTWVRIIVKSDKCYSFEYSGGSSLHLDVIFDDDTSGDVSLYDASDIIGTAYNVSQGQNENN